MRKIGNKHQLCSVHKMQFQDGREKGHNILLVENGCLSFMLLIDNCLDLYQLKHKGTNISYISKSGLIGKDDCFIDTFPGGMIYTCGLDVVGNREPMHGKIHTMPSTITKIDYNEKEIEIVAEIRQTGLFLNNLLLRRTYKTSYLSEKITIINEIINDGYVDANYCLLFHINVGYPMLDSCTKIQMPVISTTPRTEWAAKNISDCLNMKEPVDGEFEQVFYHKLQNGFVSVINDKISKMLTINYDNKMLPELIEWKSMASGDYALGIEPSTTTLDDDFSLKTIQPCEKNIYTLELSIIDL